MTPARCPALVIAAPASGQGKTTLTAALARLHRDAGRRVRVFKMGPDFLDPQVLEAAAGTPVYQLDPWMVGAPDCARLLHAAAGAADLILVEGMMGLHDGEPSTADLARRFAIPVLLVIDAWALSQTFGALALGLARYREGTACAGAMANRVAGEAHARMLAQSLPGDIPWRGVLAHDDRHALAQRHLGLVQAAETADLDARIRHAADALRGTPAEFLPPASRFRASPSPPEPATLRGVRIGIARDRAFSFIYPANIDCLRALGAEPVFFSPLADPAPPEVDALWLPGGYPELHLETLAANRSMIDALRAHHRAGKPLFAECGGMLYLCRTLADSSGQRAALVGIFDADASMQPRLAAIGAEALRVEAGTVRGHSFHHSRLEGAPPPAARATRRSDGAPGEALYRDGRLVASYLHWYFPSNPRAVAALFER